MLKPVLDFGKQALALMKDVQQNKAEIKDLRQELKDVRQELKDVRQELKDVQQEMRSIATIVQSLAFQVQRNHDNERYERELMMQRFENTVLRLRLGLPPASPSDASSEASGILPPDKGLEGTE